MVVQELQKKLKELKQIPEVAHVLRMNTRYATRLGNQFAGAITYFSLLAMVPILMFAFSACGFTLTVLRPDLLEHFQAAIMVQLEGAPEDLQAQLTGLIDRLLRNWAAVILSVFVFILSIMLTMGESFSETDGNADEKKDDTTYKVRVEVREVKNRIVEGKVRNHTIYIDQPKEFGADNTAPTPPETLAFALGSCFVSTGRLIALQRNMNLRAIEAVVESELDFAKALGTGQKKSRIYRI